MTVSVSSIRRRMRVGRLVMVLTAMTFSIGMAGSFNALVVPPAGAMAPSALDTSATAGVLTGVSCPTTSFCAAVDAEGNAVVDDDSTWSVINVDPASPLYAVSCTSASFCVAVDKAGNALMQRTLCPNHCPAPHGSPVRFPYRPPSRIRR